MAAGSRNRPHADHRPSWGVVEAAAKPRRAIDFQRDDLIDALAVAVTAAGCRERGVLTIPADPESDAYGLPMEMVYCDLGSAG